MFGVAVSKKAIHSVHPPPPLYAEVGGVKPPTKFSKRWGLTGPQLLEGGC